MSQVLQNSRRKHRPWTAQEQVTAEVAAACGVPIAQIARALGRSYGSVQYHLLANVANKAMERSRALRALQPEKVKEYQRQYYLANRDVASQRARARYAANQQKSIDAALKWSQDNRERSREIKRRWQAANREKILESKRKRYKANREQVRLQVTAWRAANPEKHSEHLRRRKAIRRSGRQRALFALNLKSQAERFALWSNCCAYCNSTAKPTVDHVLALTLGGLDEPSNVVPACSRCNSSKHTRPVESWYRAQQFFSEARWAKIQRHCPAAVVGQLPLALPA